jgi:membrane protein required for colicin V production
LDTLSYFDIIVTTLVTLLGLKGLFRGFIKEFFALIGIVGGVFIASRIASNTGELIANFIPIDNNNTMLLIGFVASFIAIWLIVYMLGTVFSKIFSLSGLGVFDKILGFVFGAGKIFLFFSIITYAVSNVEALSKKVESTTGDSVVYPMLVDTGAYIIKIDTTQLQNKISDGVDTVVEGTKDTIEDISVENMKEKVEEMKEEVIDATK